MNPLLLPLGRALLAAYGVIVIAGALPLQLRNPEWQLKMIGTFLNNAPLPLAGMAFLLLAIGSAAQVAQPGQPQEAITPATLRLRKTVLKYRYLAVLAAAGFALLAVSQLSVSWAFLLQADLVHRNQIGQLQQQGTNLRGALAQATEGPQLARAVELLVPKPERPALLAQPPAGQRKQLLQRIEDTERKARRDLARQHNQRRAAVLVDGLRNLLLCLVFGTAFLALKPKLPFLAWIRGPQGS